MYIRSTFSQQAFFIDLQLPLLTTKTTRALIDSGASDNFIDPSIISVPPHLIQTLPQPITLQLFDGSTATSGQISQFISIPVTFPRGEVQHLDFFFTTLHPHSPIVLGFSWLQENNPNIDWKELTIMFRDCRVHISAAKINDFDFKGGLANTSLEGGVEIPQCPSNLFPTSPYISKHSSVQIKTVIDKDHLPENQKISGERDEPLLVPFGEIIADSLKDWCGDPSVWSKE